MTKKEIEEKIATLEKSLDNPNVSAEHKQLMKDKIEKLKEQLKAAEEKPAPKKKEAPPRTKRKPSGKKDEEDIDCDEAIRLAKERASESKKSNKKSRTKPVFEKIADKVAGSVASAISNINVSDLTKAKLKQLDELVEDGKAYARKFRSVLGEDYDASEIESSFADLEKKVEKLKKKFEASQE